MTDVFLGIIAAAVLVMAVIQVAVIVFAARAARRVGEAVARFEESVLPIVTNLQKVSADAARVSGVAATQAERAEQLLTMVRDRVDRMVQLVQESLLRPGREALGLLRALRDIFFSGGRGPNYADSRKRQPGEEEDALFIG